MRYRNVERTLPQVARELGVDAVVEGTVQREGPRVRIAARLSRAADDGQLWAESYERDLREVLPLQSEIARAIAGAVRARVVERPGDARAAPRSVDPRAYALYLKAVHRWNEDAVASHRECIRDLEQVVALAPAFAPAHAALGEIYVHMDEWQNRSPEGRGARARALASIRRALELDERLPEAHTSLAHLLMHQEEWEAGEREYRRALELNPNHAYARILYAFHLVAQRRFDAAVEQAERAVALDPLSARTQSFAAYTLLAAGRYDAAAGRWRRMLELYPSDAGAMLGVARAHLHAGQADEGLAWAARAARARPPADSALALAYAYAVTGRRAEARAALATALRTGADALDPLDVAMTHAWIADADGALAWLRRAMEREHGWTMFLDVDPGYDPLRGDARFVELVRRMRLRS
jgi:tetratricopeptide (TPR) repeat protein